MIDRERLFWCDGCHRQRFGKHYHLETARGEYCKECSKREICSFCGEGDTTTKIREDGKWVCDGCCASINEDENLPIPTYKIIKN